MIILKNQKNKYLINKKYEKKPAHRILIECEPINNIIFKEEK